mgnify:CR=1 FL=1
MELWNIYDEFRNKTDKIHERGNELKKMNIILLYMHGLLMMRKKSF